MQGQGGLSFVALRWVPYAATAEVVDGGREYQSGDLGGKEQRTMNLTLAGLSQTLICNLLTVRLGY